MKALDEATNDAAQNPEEFWAKNAHLFDDVYHDPGVMRFLLMIASSGDEPALKLIRAVVYGIAIGMAMERQG